ncbi:hypothetical protein Agabi119p4_8595 [Agaricus bisporus var. burnettii]|uniref:F-box domain-containing protein n=1 Tax=Agaricus bisporus var. burnettii TaxID=192524 RepID=A0A8H7C646_AGABI|nr:hypothetical protein Agabi119p4_8595 [Agaricus bisporus var. burnettii]
MPTQDTESKIMSLPPDVLISLMRFLRPLDLIALRQTCRYLYEANNRRIVWITALIDVCVENDVFLPTFPIDVMTTEQLLRAATSPSRLSAFLRRNHEKKLVPTVHTILDLELSEGDFTTMLYFVPGGRFIVLLSLRTLQLWDIDAYERRYGFTGGGCKFYRIFHTSICETRHADFYLSDLPSGRFTPLISGDRLVIKVEKRNQWHCLLVWDFLNNLWAMWDGGRPFSDVLIMWGFVLLLKHKDVWALELRNLEPRGD